MNKHSVYPLIQKFYPQYDGIQTYLASECAVFCSTHEEWGILSNMAATPITVEGVEFKSAEHIFQMMKFNDPEYVQRVWNGITNNVSPLIAQASLYLFHFIFLAYQLGCFKINPYLCR